MIFLFHAQEDEETVKLILEELGKSDEVKAWPENDNITPTPERIGAIKEDIAKASFSILLFSQHAFHRRHHWKLLQEFEDVIRFVKEDKTQRKHCIPIRIDGCAMPLMEEDFPYHNLFEEGGLEQVDRIIRRTLEKPDPKEEYIDEPFFFYRQNWKWILRFRDAPLVGDHHCDPGFSYLHFVLNSGHYSLNIDSLKKVATRLHQPTRNELLGLDDDDEKIEKDLHKRQKTDEEMEEDRKLFCQIRDEILYAIQSLPGGTIRDFFLSAVKFGGDEHLMYNPFWMGRKVRWELYRQD